MSFLSYLYASPAILVLLFLVFLPRNHYAQEMDSMYRPIKPDPLLVLEMRNTQAPEKAKNKTNFEHWTYTKKTHAVVGYFGSIAQSGFSNSATSQTVHYDLGALYQGKWINTKAYKLNFHAWIEHTNLIGGDNPKQFAKNLDMFTVPNASDAENAGFSLEYLHFENFFFDGFWDVTIGKMDPTFYMTFTSYSAWDKTNYFSKTASSDPVPDMNSGFGFFTEFNFSDHFSIGGQILDDNPRNEYFDPANFFQNTSYSYQAFIRWAIPTTNNLYSYHMLDYYSYDANQDKKAGRGWLYIGNQGLTERWILTLKLSNGSGAVLKYEGAYAAGLVYLNPFSRSGDQLGGSLILNTLNGQKEFGMDTFYKFYIQNFITASVNAQVYYTKSDHLAFIPGIRVMMTY